MCVSCTQQCRGHVLWPAVATIRRTDRGAGRGPDRRGAAGQCLRFLAAPAFVTSISRLVLVCLRERGSRRPWVPCYCLTGTAPARRNTRAPLRGGGRSRAPYRPLVPSRTSATALPSWAMRERVGVTDAEGAVQLGNASCCPGRDMLATMRDRSLRATGDAPIHTQVSSVSIHTQVSTGHLLRMDRLLAGLCSAAPAYHQLGVQSWRRPAARGTCGLMLAAQGGGDTLRCKLHVCNLATAQLSKCTFSYWGGFRLPPHHQINRDAPPVLLAMPCVLKRPLVYLSVTPHRY